MQVELDWRPLTCLSLQCCSSACPRLGHCMQLCECNNALVVQQHAGLLACHLPVPSFDLQSAHCPARQPAA